mmetsp:Transcript_85781/g.277839  ORF Transcript_85781/g.277839 Transcript_85781/m.277839 type:complete len:241 (-) Transcript_85781:55-777(-)
MSAPAGRRGVARPCADCGTWQQLRRLQAAAGHGCQRGRGEQLAGVVPSRVHRGRGRRRCEEGRVVPARRGGRGRDRRKAVLEHRGAGGLREGRGRSQAREPGANGGDWQRPWPGVAGSTAQGERLGARRCLGRLASASHGRSLLYGRRRDLHCGLGGSAGGLDRHLRLRLPGLLRRRRGWHRPKPWGTARRGGTQRTLAAALFTALLPALLAALVADLPCWHSLLGGRREGLAGAAVRGG